MQSADDLYPQQASLFNAVWTSHWTKQKTSELSTGPSDPWTTLENINIPWRLSWQLTFDTLISDSQVVLEIPMTRNRSLEGSVINLHLTLASAGAEWIQFWEDIQRTSHVPEPLQDAPACNLKPVNVGHYVSKIGPWKCPYTVPGGAIIESHLTVTVTPNQGRT